MIGANGKWYEDDWRFELDSDFPVRVADDQAWVEVEAIQASGSAMMIRFHMRSDLVEVWANDRNLAVFDREALRAWLNEQAPEVLTVDDVTMSVDRSVDRDGRVAVTVSDVDRWTLSPSDQARLLDRV